jgi:cathepsin F
MSLLFVLFLSFVALSFQSEDATDLLKLNKQKFMDFIVKFNRSYTSAKERSDRFEIFQQNLKVAEKHQKNSKHARFGVTKFMDWTVEEFKAKRLGPKMPAEGLATRCD